MSTIIFRWVAETEYFFMIWRRIICVIINISDSCLGYFRLGKLKAGKARFIYMYTMMQAWSMVSIGIVAAMAGFWFGRSRNWNLEETQTVKAGSSRAIPVGKSIGSPAAGTVSAFYEGSCQGAVIHSKQEALYAPASGKIIKVYPLGHAFILRTDLGAELLLQVGKPEDELLGCYYRPRVVQNEIVNKGKLLLEFDKEGLEAAGVDTSVYIGVNGMEAAGEITVTETEQVKVGETVLWLRDCAVEL